MRNLAKPYVIGIAGGSASGKTTFTNLLLKELSVYNLQSFHTDFYYKANLPKMISPLSGKEYDDYNHPDSLDKDRYLADFIQACNRDDLDVIILDGYIIYYWPELRAKIDLKIFIELDADERMYRRIKRNMRLFGWDQEEIATYYLESARYQEQIYTLPTKAYADFVINGNRLDGVALQVIVNWVKGQIDIE